MVHHRNPYSYLLLLLSCFCPLCSPKALIDFTLSLSSIKHGFHYLQNTHWRICPPLSRFREHKMYCGAVFLPKVSNENALLKGEQAFFCQFISRACCFVLFFFLLKVYKQRWACVPRKGFCPSHLQLQISWQEKQFGSKEVKL